MKEYVIDDLNGSVFSNSVKKVMANSPLEAVKKAGYENVERVKNGGDIVVRGAYGSYVYKGVKK